MKNKNEIVKLDVKTLNVEYVNIPTVERPSISLEQAVKVKDLVSV